MRASRSRRSTQTNAPRQRRSGKGFVRGLVLFAAALAIGFGPGCSSGKSPACAGVVIEGQCQQKCSDSACAPNTRCVVFGDLNNACEPKCNTSADCPIGKDCERYEFPDKTIEKRCVRLPYSKGGRTGQNEACQKSSECDQPRGFQCIGQKCVVPCQWSADCPDGYCAPAGNDENGKPAKACVNDTFPRGKGQYGSDCPNGSSDCDGANNFTCMGVGKADPFAYCTQRDCTADKDCPTGYFCSLQGTATVPCKTTCGITGDSTKTDCAKASDIGAGKKFQCGPGGLERHYCMKREFCNECQTDADCAEEKGQICAKDKSGNKICTQICDPKGHTCPWGAATECGIWDKQLGEPTCSHRYGSCKGTGQGCDPCVDDNDCGPNGVCIPDMYTGEHFCLNVTESCSCPAGTTGQFCVGGGCPHAAGGKSSLTMLCGNSGNIKGLCFEAYSVYNPLTSDMLLGCWPQQ